MKNKFLLIALLFLFNTVNAQDGQLDISFNTNGKLMTNFGQYYASLNAVQQLPNGQILVAGSVANNNSFTSFDFLVARYNSNGSIDPSFGTNGFTTIDFSSNYDAANALAIQSDGKILVAGRSTSNVYYDVAIARLNANGQLDNSFNGSGKVLVDLQGESDEARTITLQKDGKIIIAGLSSTATAGNALALRLNTDGSLDNSFGTNGHVLFTFTGAAYFSSCLVMNDGSIALAGSTIVLGNSRMAMAKINSNGTAASGFGTNGQAEFLETAGQSSCAALRYNPFNQNFYLAGMCATNAYMLSIKNDGSINPSFATNGRANFDLGGSEIFNSFCIDQNGDFLLCGNNYINNSYESFVAKLKANGTADNAWGSSGATSINWSIANDYGTAMTLQSDGKLLMVGSNDNGLFSHIARFNNSTTAVNGTKEIAIQESAINCYPNPACTQVYFDIPETDLVRIELFNLVGVKLLETNKTFLDVNCIPNGEYLILIHSKDTEVKTAQIIVNH